LNQRIGILMLMGLICGGCENLLYYPQSEPFDQCPELEKVNGRAVKDQGLRYLLIPAQNKTKARMILFHGNASTACDGIHFANWYIKRGIEVILPEYPGYGQPGRKPNHKLILQDALDIVDYFAKSSPKLPLILMGQSIGNGPVIYAASRRQVDLLILHTPYSCINSVAGHHFPFLPIRILLGRPYPVKDWAVKSTAPSIILHGTADTVIPIKFGRQLVQYLNPAPVFIEIPGGTHNNLSTKYQDIYFKEVDTFLREYGF
jgi:uncharacterized protein